MQQAWEAVLYRPIGKNLSSKATVCSEHFREEDLIKTNNRTYLKSGAVPSLKLGPRLGQVSLAESLQNIPGTSYSKDSSASVSEESETHCSTSPGSKKSLSKSTLSEDPHGYR